MSLKVKLTPREGAVTASAADPGLAGDRPGAGHLRHPDGHHSADRARPRCGIRSPGLDPELDERRPRCGPAGLGRDRRRGGSPAHVRRRSAPAGHRLPRVRGGARQRRLRGRTRPGGSRGSGRARLRTGPARPRVQRAGRTGARHGHLGRQRRARHHRRRAAGGRPRPDRHRLARDLRRRGHRRARAGAAQRQVAARVEGRAPAPPRRGRPGPARDGADTSGECPDRVTVGTVCLDAAALRGQPGRTGGVRRGRGTRRRTDDRPGAAADAGLPRRHPRCARPRRRRDRDDLQRADARAGRTGRIAVDGDLVDHRLVGHQRRRPHYSYAVSGSGWPGRR